MKSYFVNLYKAILGNTTTQEKVVFKEVAVQVEVLSSNSYLRLERELENPICTGSDSPTNAAYKLGIQRALQQVRKNFALY